MIGTKYHYFDFQTKLIARLHNNQQMIQKFNHALLKELLILTTSNTITYSSGFSHKLQNHLPLPISPPCYELHIPHIATQVQGEPKSNWPSTYNVRNILQSIQHLNPQAEKSPHKIQDK